MSRWSSYKITYSLKLIFASVLMGIATSCLPTISEMHSARMLEEGEREILPVLSVVPRAEVVAPGAIYYSLGIHSTKGVRPGLNWRTRVDFVGATQWDYQDSFLGSPKNFGISSISTGPKFSIIKDRLAFYLPVGFSPAPYVYNDGEKELFYGWFEACVLSTWPIVADRLDLNFSAKVMPFTMPFSDHNAFFSTQIGLAFGKSLSNSGCFRVEYAFTYPAMMTQNAGFISVGYAFRFKRKVKKQKG